MGMEIDARKRRLASLAKLFQNISKKKGAESGRIFLIV